MESFYYHVVCPVCGWSGMSNDCPGGHPNGDAGDFDDLYCPKCLPPCDICTEPCNADYCACNTCTKGKNVVVEEDERFEDSWAEPCDMEAQG